MAEMTAPSARAPQLHRPRPPLADYIDQAHFVREFRSFTEMTPSEYVRRRPWLPSHVEPATVTKISKPTHGPAQIIEP
jgi:hypothetical protein